MQCGHNFNTYPFNHASLAVNIGAAAEWSERRSLSRENPGSNPLAAVSKLWQFRSSHVATIHSAV